MLEDSDLETEFTPHRLSRREQRLTESFDPEIEHILRRLRRAQRSREDQQEDMAENQMTLSDYAMSNIARARTSIVRPIINTNNFEIKHDLIQMVQQA